MATRVFIDGRITDENGAVVPVLDRGFLYGDSVYEVTRTSGGRPVDLGRHLDRLERSAAAIGLDLPARASIAGAVGAAGSNPSSTDRSSTRRTTPTIWYPRSLEASQTTREIRRFCWRFPTVPGQNHALTASNDSSANINLPAVAR